MIIDDDQSAINGLISYVSWEKLNLHVIGTANNGEDALDLIIQNPPDILITDIYMPKMTGLNLIKQLFKTFPEINIIIHSGYNHFDNARQAIQYGVKYFFLKPATIDEIEMVLEDVLQEMDAHEKQKKIMDQHNKRLNEYLLYTKQALIREMINDRYSSAKIAKEKLELLDLMNMEQIVVASLSMIRPPYLSKSKEEEWQLIKFSSTNIIQETIKEFSLPRSLESYIVDYSDSTFVLVFFCKGVSVENLDYLIKNLTQKIVNNILLYLKVSSNVGIGRETLSIHELHQSFLESQRVLEAVEFQELNKVFCFDEVNDKEKIGAFQYPLEILKQLHNAIAEKNVEEVIEIWKKFDEEITENELPLFVVQNICISTVNALMIDRYNYNQLVVDSKTVYELVTTIYSQPSTKELSDWMKKQSCEWMAQMKEELTGKKSHKLIHEVKQYVQDYYDEEITLAEIAESLYINKNYLSQLFKKVTGETFVNYLNKFRIEKAKEKLKEQKYMIYEVSEMVGYQNPTYFSKVFRSITGTSPSDFYM
ncbi:response regulator transcription factor [Aquibacillus salsiterrae]|uniref:Response regulator n=1 Tax=Aquibacillus salsiterrae TaxID=2950439 RepID=A0A9X3WBC7_9BACI|nr:response regulator [Aquibacillus salsiterrae]MDC3416007.1 response regulator [Aquibacillus salsiterrae]